MASAFTHAFVGAAVATLAPRPFRGAGLAVLLAALAAAPDLDIVGFRAGIPYAHPLGHRGLTHAPSAALVVALLVAWALAARRGVALASRAGLGLSAVIFLAIASHGVLDALTHGGLGVGFLLPFDTRRDVFGFRPLAASPLSARAFFSPLGAEILAQEMRWVWLPIAAGVAALLVWRRVRRPAGGALGDG